MRQIAAVALAAGFMLLAALWLWISLSLPFEDLDACGGGAGWLAFQVFQKLVAAGGTVAAVVCVYGAGRYAASRGGTQFFFIGAAAVSFTFFGWILMMGIAYTAVCS